jgi:hypothetical protein
MAAMHAQVSQHLQCVVRLSIVDRGANTNDYFKINGIAVVPYQQPRLVNLFEEMALAREQLFLDAYKSRLAPNTQLASDAAIASASDCSIIRRVTVQGSADTPGGGIVRHCVALYA